jgi:endo-1,4-beta-xylanase
MRNNIKKQSQWFCAIAIIFLVIGLSMTACKSTESAGNSNTANNNSGNKSGSMPLTNLYEVALCVEGYNISGNATITENTLSIKGTPVSSYDWEYWTNPFAEGSITPAGSSPVENNGTGTSRVGTFTCKWISETSNGNFLARSGKKWTASNQTHTQIGDISIKYDAEYNPSGNGVSYLCVYGWMRNNTSNPSLLIEYYIVDNWGMYNRPVGSWDNPVNKGTLSVDGGTYDIYVVQKRGQPSINGQRDFMQYWSVRKTRRNSGTISVSEHFKKWESIK